MPTSRPTSRDIESLFKRFGGDAGRYHEVRAEADADAARTRWPLLGGVELRERESQGQPGAGSPDGADTLRKIVLADKRASPVSAPDAGTRHQTPGALKKLVSRPASSEGPDAQGSSQPLVRLFERLRTNATGEAQAMQSVWTSRS
ncbi:cellulose biosynthesis protein BcsP [Burkholderia contaminans]|uniref:cellulose biosynthesis protein BcsP n=1 Tax=Burkholderia contaminans TaxID=488447 RepID=UPI0021F46FA9|nr:cellulose biosynthesis protein BcsP [Burkholderia contaminans]